MGYLINKKHVKYSFKISIEKNLFNRAMRRKKSTIKPIVSKRGISILFRLGCLPRPREQLSRKTRRCNSSIARSSTKRIKKLIKSTTKNSRKAMIKTVNMPLKPKKQIRCSQKSVSHKIPLSIIISPTITFQATKRHCFTTSSYIIIWSMKIHLTIYH